MAQHRQMQQITHSPTQQINQHTTIQHMHQLEPQPQPQVQIERKSLPNNQQSPQINI